MHYEYFLVFKIVIKPQNTPIICNKTRVCGVLLPLCMVCAKVQARSTYSMKTSFLAGHCVL